VQQAINHPTGDGKLPSFHHPKLADIIEDLDLVHDCWTLLKGEAKKRHLPKEPGEPAQAYKNRVRRSSYPNFYEAAIKAFAGVLSRYELRNAPKGLIDAAQDIDGLGNSLKKWGMMADELVLRDGGCLLMVDMPKDTPENRAEELASGRRPLFSIAERRNVLNWKLKKHNGRMVPYLVTVLEWHEEEDGEYGQKLEPRYRVMKGGKWQLLKITGDPVSSGSNAVSGKNSAAKFTVELVDKGEFLGANNVPLQFPPVRWYNADGKDFGEGDIQLLSLANLSLDWFREYSDLKELLHKCALPVAVVKGRRAMVPVPGAGGGAEYVTPPLALGPNSLVEFPDGNGDLTWSEPSGGSLAQHLEHLKAIEGLIDRQTLSFLFSGSGDKTATHAQLESAQVQAGVTSWGEMKSSAHESLFQLWGAFTGEPVEPGAGLDLLPGIMDKPVDDPLLQLASTLYDKGLLMRETVTHLAQKRGMLRPGVTAEDEAEQLAEEDRKREELLNPPLPDENDSDTQDNTNAQGLPLA
jgi:hypothetical protein